MSDLLRAFEYSLVERMEALLDSFHQHLLDQGLSARQAEKRLANADLFLIQYHTFQYLEDIDALTPAKASDFLNHWYFQKVDAPSAKDLRMVTDSIISLFNYLKRTETIPEEQADFLLAACGVRVPFETRLEEHRGKARYLRTRRSEADSADSRNFSDSRYGDAYHELDTYRTLTELFRDMEDDLKNEERMSKVVDLKSHRTRVQQPQPAYQTERAEEVNLREWALALHRVNRVFQRWLERFGHSIREAPTDQLSAFLQYEDILVRIVQLSQQKQPTAAELTTGKRQLNRLDKRLWDLRRRIALDLNLDLRSLRL
ncbi:MAG: hypothetical protein GC154_02805 [bacterium]|nr:hypothetical protein [bacterium]